MFLSLSAGTLVEQGTPSAQKRIDHAYENTRFAADRTMMASMRTSISLIGFGFTIYKFFQYMRESGLTLGALPAQGPRNFGLALVILGMVLLVIAMGDYYLFLRQLSQEAQRKFPLSSTLLASLLMFLLGMIALIELLFRFGPF